MMELDPATLTIRLYPDPCLREKAETIDPAEPTVRLVAERMLELMHEFDGVGLAGPQVGLAWRIFVMNARDADPEDRVFINPRLTLHRGELVPGEEGCLSIPGVNAQIRRPDCIDIEAHDIHGTPFSMSLDGIRSRICQHENDHLDGILILDKLNQMDKLSNRKAIRELEATYAGA